MPTRNAQDIAESPRITSTECAGLSRCSLDGASLGRFASKSRTRVLRIFGNLKTSNPTQRPGNETPAREGWPAFPLAALLSGCAPSLQPWDSSFLPLCWSACLIVPARKLIDRQSPPCVSVRLRRVDRGERALDIGLDNGSVPERQDLLRKPLSTSDAALGATSAIRSGNESLGGGPVCATRSRARGICRTSSILLAAPAGGR